MFCVQNTMPLGDLERDLYDPKSDIGKREHEKSSFDVDKTIEIGGDDEKFNEIKESWEKQKNSGIDPNRKRIMIIGGITLGVIFVFSALAVAFNFYKQGAFSQSRVTISIDGSREVKSSQDYSYLINYENNNRATLENVEIVLNHSENFYPEEGGNISRYSDRSSRIIIGDIRPKGKGQIEVVGKFYAAENYTVYLQPVMTYKPSSSSSKFMVESQVGVKVTTSPISLEIKAPKEALNESTAEYEIKYKNNGTIAFKSLNLKLEYADGFIFQGAVPAPVDGDNVWHIGDLNPNGEGSILMQGKIIGDKFDVKSIKAIVYKNESNQKEVVFGKAEEVTKVVIPPLAVSHKINDQSSLNINLGEELKYNIEYANRGDIALRDVIIKLKVDSPVINYPKLLLDSGAYDSSTKTITWKASDIVELENLDPGDNGSINLVIPIKGRIDINSEGDKNFLIESIVTIDSSDVNFHSLGASKNISNKVVAKLNSKVILEQQAFYNDSNIENSGPIPPKVGEETSYTIHWKVSNVSNGISDTKVVAYLPTWAKWKGKIFPENEDIKFNERTHEIVWNIGKVKNGTGILNDPKEASFQVSILPEINQLGKEIPIMTKTILTAKDDFTLNDINEEIREKTTNIKEDDSVDSGGYEVVE